MRPAFIETLLAAAAADPRIFLVNGDLGFGVLEPFVQRFPRQYLNVGVAEQNLIGVAVGLALEGYRPVAYTIATFAAFRAYEFLRNDVCFQNVNVKIVGVGAGLCYPQYAATHQAIDDIAALRTLPNLVILNPGDPWEARWATRAMFDHVGPVYLRIGKKGEPTVHPRVLSGRLGQGFVLAEGSDVAVLVSGSILAHAADAARRLTARGISVRLISLPTIKPLDVDLIRRTAREIGILCTVEEAMVTGALGTAVAEVLMEPDVPRVKFQRIGLPDAFPAEIGSQEYLRRRYGLSGEQLAERMVEMARS